MARAGAPGTIRGEAAARGVSEYQIRVERAAARGVTRSVGVGKPRRGELTLTEQRWGYRIARVDQPTRYRIWWAEVLTNDIAAVDNVTKRPGNIIGDIADDPFEAGYEDQPIYVLGVTVKR